MINKKLLSIIVLGFISLIIVPSAAAVSCNSGSLSTTCYIQSNQNVGGQTISGSGDLVVTGGNKLYTGMWGDVATIDMGGEVLVDGELEGNFRVYANKIDIQGTWDGNRKGWNDNSGPCEGDNCASASTPQQPGSGGDEGGYGKKRGGDGGGFIRLSGTVVNIDGAMYARGQDGRKVTYCCDPDGEGGAGGSVWVIAGRLTGNGYIDLDGGANGGGGENGRIAYWYDESAESIDERTRQSFNTYELDGSESFTRDITSEWSVDSVGNIPRFTDELTVVDGNGNPVSGQTIYLKSKVGGVYEPTCAFTTDSNGVPASGAGSGDQAYLNSCTYDHWEGQTSIGYPNEGSSLFSGDTQDNWAISLTTKNTDEFDWIGGMPKGETRTYEGSDKNIGFNNVTLNTDLTGDYWFNFTVKNQTNDILEYDPVTIYKAGTDVVACRGRTNVSGFFRCALDQNEIYDVVVDTTEYQSEMEYRNVRAPDNITIGMNQNFLPESTLSNSRKFSAGHVLPAQTFVMRPFSDFDVVNVSVEKNLRSDFRLVSNILVRKYNVAFEGAWQDWSNRKTVSVKDIYNEDWDDSTAGNNDAWGTMQFNPEGFQNNDCSDVRLTDTDNNVMDYNINTCQDDFVSLEYNVPIDPRQEKDFYLYYGNSEASDAQSTVERPSRALQTDFDTGKTGYNDLFSIWDQDGDVRGFNVTVPQNIDFTAREMTLSGVRTQYVDNSVPVTLDTAYNDFTGVEVEPTREYILENITIQLASTTVDTEFVIVNQSSGDPVIVRDIPDNGAGSHTIDFHNDSTERTGNNTVLKPGNRYFLFLRNGEAMRSSSENLNRPMYNLEDTTVHRQLFSCNSDGSGCTEGDYPVLVSDISTVDPDYPTNVNVSYEGTTIWEGPEQLKDQWTIDLSSQLSSESWDNGDPIDDPRLHEFTVSSGTNGNISIGVTADVQFEHPVLEVTKDSSACSVQPQSRNYFHIDRTDCPYFDRVNISEGQWFKLDYRFRIPGPHDFNSIGDTNAYNVTDTMVRFDIITETEEFTG